MRIAVAADSSSPYWSEPRADGESSVCRVDAYLIQKTSALVLEIKYKAMPKQPSLGYDRLFAILARGGL
jgi:hypothetical protein